MDKKVPGYTGYKPLYLNEKGMTTSFGAANQGSGEAAVVRNNRFFIPGNFIFFFYCFLGYSGYIPGVKAENVFGESYGKTTAISVKNEFPRGF